MQSSRVERGNVQFVASMVSAVNLCWLATIWYLTGIESCMLPSLLSRFICGGWLIWTAIFDAELEARDFHR